jgi:hypothetical protein
MKIFLVKYRPMFTALRREILTLSLTVIYTVDAPEVLAVVSA